MLAPTRPLELWNIVIKIIITEFAVDKFDSLDDQRQSPHANDKWQISLDDRLDSVDDQRQNPYVNDIWMKSSIH